MARSISFLSLWLAVCCLVFILSSYVDAHKVAQKVECKPSVTTTSKISCRTRLAQADKIHNKDPKHLKHKPLPSITKTVTKHRTSTICVHKTPTVTVTPPKVTVRRTAIQTATVTTTNSAVTDTLTVSTTPRTTQTATVTATSTITVDGEATSTITVVSTSTVATPANYTPLESQIVALGKQPSRRCRRSDPTPAPEHQLEERHGQEAACFGTPKEVRCTKTVKIVTLSTTTKQSKRTSTITKCPRSTTVTATVTATSTQTVALPNVSITTTVTAPTITQFETVTTTTTATVSTPAVATATAIAGTVYAACSPDNMVSRIDGRSINGVGGGPEGSKTDFVPGSHSASECCGICQSTSNCFNWIQLSGSCILQVMADRCPVPWVAYKSGGQGTGFTVGNGACGSAAVSG